MVSLLGDVALQYLELDPRPTCILNHVDSPALLYSNLTFVELQQSSKFTDECYAHIKNGKTLFTTFCHGLRLRVRVFATRWNGKNDGAWVACIEENAGMFRRLAAMTYGTPVEPTVRVGEALTDAAGTRFEHVSTDNKTGRPLLDWTKGSVPMENGPDAEFYAFLRSVDWSKTSLGPISSWSVSLQRAAASVMAISRPTTLYVGPEGIFIYNHAWAKSIAMGRHPKLMGSKFKESWPEIYDHIMPMIRRTWVGETVDHERVLFFLNRTGELEECYYDFTLSPVTDDDGCYQATFTQAFDKTRSVIQKRCLKVLQSLTVNTSKAKTFSREAGFWEGALNAFDDNHCDSPIVMMYRVDGKVCELMGGRGIPDSLDCQIALDGYTADGSLPSVFLPGIVDATDQNEFVHYVFDEAEVERINMMPCRGFGECRATVTIPLNTTEGHTHTFLVLGLNHRRPFDSFYKTWVANIKYTMTTSVVRIWHAQEEEKRFGEMERVARERIESFGTTANLLKMTKELKESELMFFRTAAAVPVGLVFLDAEGNVTWANDAWFKICTLGLGNDPNKWDEVLYHEDREAVLHEVWDAITNRRQSSMEFRCGTGEPDKPIVWTRNSIDPNFDEEGNLTGFFATLVDTSSFKKAEEYQRQLTTDAIESKRQQDNFIASDSNFLEFEANLLTCVGCRLTKCSTSHELRNPLSAILQSADEIQTLVESVPESHDSVVSGILEAADTILACGEHQKKIIDDILNVSKMDAGILTIDPLPIKPHESLQRAMKMFTPQFKSVGITSKFETTSMYRDLCKEDHWLIDPARMNQILINLVSNAIKFTGQKQGSREVNVTIDASKSRPAVGDNFAAAEEGVYFTPADEDAVMTESGTYFPNKDIQEAVYVRVYVQDTGIGISKDWRKVVGQRYQQAPRTHITYGGSGLGLFIARKMAVLLGGELPFDSEQGVGSTFAFFVRAPRAPMATLSPPTTPARKGTSPIRTPGLTRQRTRDRITRHRTSPYPKKLGVGYIVLVVEDNILNQTILRKQLINQGCITYVANNGLEALNTVIEHGNEFTLVLMDMEMPVMDGVKATEQIRAMEALKKEESGEKRHVPIIGTSANARVQQIETMRRAGMDDTISKPFLIMDLMTKIQSILERLKFEAATPALTVTGHEDAPQ